MERTTLVQRNDPETWRKYAAASDEVAVAAAFERFGRAECAGYSRFYEELSLRIAREPRLLSLCVRRVAGQPAPNLLFGAVRDLLGRGLEPRLAAHYARAARDGPTASGEQAWEDFLAFVLAHREQVRSIVSTRRVQTNETGRSAPLAYGVAAAMAPHEGQPVAVVEIGTSAGLLLGFDRYAIEYRSADGVIARRGPEASPVSLACEVRGPAARHLLTSAIRVASRDGIDLDPVDVRDPAAVRWLRALVWPERPEREHRLVAAVTVMRATEMRLHGGNAAELLPGLLERIPSDRVVCVFHSSCWHQVGDEDRHRIDAAIADASARRPLVRVSLESLDGVTNELRVGPSQERLLGRAHPHGLWLEVT